MTFPIAVGTGPRHSSSRPFPRRSRAGGIEARCDDDRDAIMAYGTNDDQTLSVMVFIGYHCIEIPNDTADGTRGKNDSDDDDGSGEDGGAGAGPTNNDPNDEESREPARMSTRVILQESCADARYNVVAELRVQITPATSPFSSNADAMSSRETKSRVPLGIMRKRRSPTTTTTYLPNASIEFSSNGTHLACLIPLPTSHELISSNESHPSHGENAPASTMVIFRIQARKFSSRQQSQQRRQRNLPKLPDYIMERASMDGDPNEELENDNPHHITERNDASGANETTQEGSANPPVATSSSRSSVSYVAHEPRIVREPLPRGPSADASVLGEPSNRPSFFRQLSGGGGAGPAQTPPLRRATCACDLPSSPSSASSLLVGTAGGSLLLVDYASARVRSVALDSKATDGVRERGEHGDQDGGDGRGVDGGPGETSQNIASSGNASRSDGPCNPIVHLSQRAPTRWKPPDIYGEERGSESRGRIAAVLRDGSARIYATSFAATSALSGPSRGFDDSTDVDGDRSGGSGNNSRMRAGLEMKMELLAASCAAGSSFCASRLRYIRAKWMNPLVLALLTRSPYLDEDCSNSIGAITSQSETVVAQVWTVAEVADWKDEGRECIDRVDGWKIPPGVGTDVSLVSELKMPCGDDLDERAHGSFFLSRSDQPMMNGVGGEDPLPGFVGTGAADFAECARGASIFHHGGTDSLALGSLAVTRASFAPHEVATLRARPFCLIWDWKRNVPGFTLAGSETFSLRHCRDADSGAASSLSSWFHLGEDEDHGPCVVHVYGRTLSRGRRRACKNVFDLSTLSPLNRSPAEGGLSLNEPSAVLLHCDSVTFPSLGTPSNNTRDVSIRWEESRVPPAYFASNGPCRIAAVGKSRGRSVAVAAARGLCVLDLPQTTHRPGPPGPAKPPRWKQFGNVMDERRFRVVSMIWFERGDATIPRAKEDSSEDDLLLAVVQYANFDELHLVCWSRKRLGFGEDQLLRESSWHFAGEEDTGDDDVSQFGMALPQGFRVHSMSMIRDPADSLPSGRSASSNRAVLLLAFVSCHEGASGCVKYGVYQLQRTRSPDGLSEAVLARLACLDHVPLQLGTSPDFSATESVIGIFVAGGSFLFDLDEGIETEDQALHDVIAVLGIVTLFQGLVVVCVNGTGPILYRPSLLESADQRRVGNRNSLIVSYWMSGAVSSRFGCGVAWSIAKNDGGVFCWSVPCRNTESSRRSSMEVNGGQRSEGLPGIENHSILGEICHLGSSSLWMNGATTSEREISIGPFCPLSLGCTLYAGQRSRKTSSASDSAFHVSNCIVAPPQFTPFLFILLLSLSSTTSDLDLEWQLVNHSGPETAKSLGIGLRHELARNYIKSTLSQVKHLGSGSSAMRIITLKVVDMLNDSKAVGAMCLGSENRDELSNEASLLLQKWTAAKAILSEIVSVAKDFYDGLGFATFFLSVGRQLEPHQFNLIFPLPSDPPPLSLPPPSCTATAEDLFRVSCERGSLATAVSALPLFSCHAKSQQSVTKLIYHCLIKIEENFRTCSFYTARTSEEDEAFLHQLFWFGIKLEDAIEIENLYEKEVESISTSESSGDGRPSHSSKSSVSSSSTPNDDESSIDQDTDEFVSVSPSVESHAADYTLDTNSSEESIDVSFLSPCRTPKQKPRVGVIKKVVTKLFPSADASANTNSLEEVAIHEAASSFILSGFGENPIESPPCTPLSEASNLDPGGDDPSDSDERPVNASTPMTVAGAVSTFIGHAIAFDGSYHKKNTLNYGWKAVSAIAYLLQGDRETDAITRAGSANAQSIVSSMKTEDFLVADATYNHVGKLRTEEGDSCNSIAIMLVHLTYDCSKQIHSQAFGTVFNLILLLLLRHDSCYDVELCGASLIAVGIVSGHLSGRIRELLDFSEIQFDVKTIYSIYAAQINDT